MVSKMKLKYLGIIILTLTLISLFITKRIDSNVIQAKKEFAMKIESSAFSHNQTIPPKYTCNGENISPPLKFEAIPDNAQSLALIVDDPDAPMGTWVHWVVYNINPNTTVFAENTKEATQGINDFREIGYGGPCPPFGTHRYFFKLYAVDKKLNLPQGATKAQVESAIKGHIIESAELIGLYKKQ